MKRLVFRPRPLEKLRLDMDGMYKIGHRVGREEGIAKGRAEGIAEGRNNVYTTVVLNMLQNGSTENEIAGILELSVDQVRALIAIANDNRRKSL